MRIMTNRLGPAALSLGILALAACDVTNPLEDVELRLNVQNAPVEIPASVGTVVVRSGEPTINEGTATNDTDIDRVEDLESITIDPSFFTYTPAAAGGAGASAAPAASLDGTIRLFIFLGGVPVPGTPVALTVEDAVVTAVEPQELVIAGSTVDASAVAAFIESLPAESRPQLDDWQSMTIDQVIGEINAALSSGSVPIAIGIEATGGLDGNLQLEQIEFDAVVVVSQ